MAKAGLGEALVNAQQHTAARWFALHSRLFRPRQLRITPLSYRCVPRSLIDEEAIDSWAQFEGVEPRRQLYIGMVAVGADFATQRKRWPNAQPVIARTVGRLAHHRVVIANAPPHVLPEMSDGSFRYGVRVSLDAVATTPALLQPSGQLWMPPSGSFAPEGKAIPFDEAYCIPWATRLYN